MKHLKPTKACLLLLLSLLLSCAPVNNITVSSVNDDDAIKSASFIYSLPLTVLDINVIAEEISIVPGPYEKFAKKYLSISNVISRPEKSYHIKRIELSQHIEGDPDFLYSASGIANPSSVPALANLLKDSLILNANAFSAFQINNYGVPLASDGLYFTDLSVKRNFEAEKDVEISSVMPDTLYASRPASRNALREKTIEQKAEEAANFLIKLKKRRFKLVAGQYDNMPDGESMASALSELARLEEEYLALFIGRRIVNEVKRTYHYVPVQAGKNAENIVLFRFAADKGYIDSREVGGIPVMLELEASRKLKDLEYFKLPMKPSLNQVPYRIPDQADIKIKAGEQTWIEASLPVFQYGVNVTMNLNK